jgi:hypothetical protein
VQTATLEMGHCANFTAVELVADIFEQVDAGEVHGALEVGDTATSKQDVRGAIMGVGESKYAWLNKNNTKAACTSI